MGLLHINKQLLSLVYATPRPKMRLVLRAYLLHSNTVLYPISVCVLNGEDAKGLEDGRQWKSAKNPKICTIKAHIEREQKTRRVTKDVVCKIRLVCTENV